MSFLPEFSFGFTLPEGYVEIPFPPPGSDSALSDVGANAPEVARAMVNPRWPRRVQSCYSSDFSQMYAEAAERATAVPHVLCKYCSTVGPDGQRCSYCGANDCWRHA